jgi:soluble lytic murein transglycosylase-like protein
MRMPIHHYKWSARRSVTIVLIGCVLLTIVPHYLSESSIQLKPISKADLHRIISQNHPNPQLVKAIIQVESRWNPNAVSSKGAIGLMQVLPSSGKHFAGYSRTDLFCPEKNIIAGTKILAYYQRTSPTLQVALNKYSGNAKGYYNKIMEAM